MVLGMDLHMAMVPAPFSEEDFRQVIDCLKSPESASEVASVHRQAKLQALLSEVEAEEKNLCIQMHELEEMIRKYDQVKAAQLAYGKALIFKKD